MSKWWRQGTELRTLSKSHKTAGTQVPRFPNLLYSVPTDDPLPQQWCVEQNHAFTDAPTSPRVLDIYTCKKALRRAFNIGGDLELVCSWYCLMLQHTLNFTWEKVLHAQSGIQIRRWESIRSWQKSSHSIHFCKPSQTDFSLIRIITVHLRKTHINLSKLAYGLFIYGLLEFC